MKSLFKVSTILALMSPFIALAQTSGSTGDVPVLHEAATTQVDSWFNAASSWIATIAILLIAIAVVIFFWGIIQYVMAGADEEKRASGRNLIIYGIIGIFIMVALWGLIYVVGGTLGVNIGGGTATPDIPGGVAQQRTP